MEPRPTLVKSLYSTIQNVFKSISKREPTVLGKAIKVKLEEFLLEQKNLDLTLIWEHGFPTEHHIGGTGTFSLEKNNKNICNIHYGSKNENNEKGYLDITFQSNFFKLYKKMSLYKKLEDCKE